MDTANTAMKSMQLPLQMQRDVTKYLHITRDTQEKQQELNEFLLRLSPSLKFKIQQSMFSKVL